MKIQVSKLISQEGFGIVRFLSGNILIEFWQYRLPNRSRMSVE